MPKSTAGPYTVARSDIGRMTWKQSFSFYARTLGYFRNGLPQVVLQLVLMGAAVLLGVLSAFPLAILIDGVFGTRRDASWAYRLFFFAAPSSIPRQLVLLAIITLLLRVAQEILTMIQTLLGIKVGYGGLMKVRCELFSKLQQLSLADHRGLPQGDAIYRLAYDTFGFQTILNILTQNILVSVITLFMMLWIMLSMNWRMTLIAMIVTPPLIWATMYYGKIFRQRATAAKEADTQLTSDIQRSVSAIELVQAFGREADELARFQDSVGHSVQTWLALHWEEVCYWLVIGVTFGAGGALIFGYGGWLVWRDQMVLHNPNGFTIGKLSIFVSYLGQLYGPLNKLSGSGSNLQGAVVGAGRVFEVLDRHPTITDAPDAYPLGVQPRQLHFDNVSFGYPRGDQLLHNLSLRIEPGQMVAFVGSSGVGKTTLLNLLPRFYDPTAGALRLDGHDLRKIKLRHLRRHVALVLQENSILPATVMENIAYGHPRAGFHRVRRAAEMAGALEFVEKLPRKFHTRIGESGITLSGGQRQRIAIARALLTEAPIIVLDEPTSALDAQHEAVIIETLRALKGQRTIILVSHRLSTVADCSRIFVLEEGTIVESGSHDELLARRGVYHSMASHQLKLQESAVPTG